MNSLIAKIAVEKVKYNFDILYSYTIPDAYLSDVKIGSRVLVPFGKQDTKRQGIIFNLVEKTDTDNLSAIKNILMLIDETPLIDIKTIELVKWIKNMYYSTYFEILKLFLPFGTDMNPKVEYKIDSQKLKSLFNTLSNDEINLINNISNCDTIKVSDIQKLEIKNYKKIFNELLKKEIIYVNKIVTKNVGEKLLKVVELNNGFEKDYNSVKSLTNKQKTVCEYITNNGKSTVKEICYYTGVGKSVIYTMVKNGILKYSDIIKKIDYTNVNGTNNFLRDKQDKQNVKPIQLSEPQNKVYNQILSKYNEFKYNVSLLHGVTGSGKTIIFFKLIDYVLTLNKNIIFMVPEIALTTQMINTFKNRYGNDVAVIHSGLSKINRMHEWQNIKNNKTRIIIGTRSAVFSPCKNLGLIIIDEEHEHTYKSESNPRFDAKNIAKVRCRQNDCMLLLSSATPSIESYFKTQIGNYNLFSLESRYGNAKLPQVEIVDMNEEVKKGNIFNFSKHLIDSINKNIDNNYQTILLLNRRGYNTFIKCRVCNEVIMCPNCNISLNYHKANNRLMCHYCGYSENFIDRCPKCFSKRILYLGSGTQKLETELEKLIPRAKILRVDADTITAENSYKEKFDSFLRNDYNIIVGTQMVAKGLNFPNVTLVGVISVDQALYNSDFRSYEKTFSLITQVVGRSGRGEHSGKAIIQTFTPENEVLHMAANQDYKSFYESEISIRKAMLYPPFADICMIGFSSENEKSTFNASMEMFEIIKNTATSDYPNIPLRIFKPTIANVNKICNKYRYKIVLKCKNNKIFREMMSKVIIQYENQSKYKNVNVFIDTNPDTII